MLEQLTGRRAVDRLDSSPRRRVRHGGTLRSWHRGRQAPRVSAMTERERVVRLILDRGRYHADDFCRQVDAFFATNPWSVVPVDDPKERRRQWCLRMAPSPPPVEPWSLILG